MKLDKIFTGLALSSLLLSSCDRMDYHEYTAYDEEYIQRSFAYVGGFMAKIYNDIDTDWGNYSGAMLASATDEAEYSHDGNQIEYFYNGTWSASIPLNNIWSSAYEGITYCNEMLDNWTGLQFEQYRYNKDYEQQMFLYNNYQFEARWARAYFYYNLVRQYKNVPFKLHNTTGTEETALACTSSDVIFDFIESECDAIKDTIIADYTNIGDMALYKPQTGRASKYSVLALKAQAALYHASPLFSEGKSDEEKKQLWYKAALANKELIDACEQGGKKLAVSLDTLWCTDYVTDAQCYGEILFARRTAAANTFEGYNFPVGYSSGQGGNCPTQDLVDAFEMKKSGLPISEEGSGYDPQNPYAGRDPRLAMTVAVNGEKWPNDLADYTPAHPVLETYVGGYHSRKGEAAGASYATTTGYYLKKFCNPSQILRGRSGHAVTTSAHGWLTFRLGGMYLNYAEAVFQYNKACGMENAADAAGEFPSPVSLASKTRVRAGMPAFKAGMTNDEFWARYKNERRVELAFEGHRFYDVRRWKEADEAKKFMNISRMEITQNVSESQDTTYTYNVVKTVRGDGQWQEKWNLFPFPQTEIIKSGNTIKQNKDW